MTKIEVQCQCGFYVPVEYKKELGRFTGMCPNTGCQIWNNMQVIELETQKNHFESNTNDVKECHNCKKIWVNSHTCKGDKFAQQKAIMEAMN